MNTGREQQIESWWLIRYCPVIGFVPNVGLAHCKGNECAFWRVTKIDENGRPHGICTKS